MGRNKCPRCGHVGLSRELTQRVRSGDTHKMEKWSCPECGWSNI